MSTAQAPLDFDGVTYEALLDGTRLNAQMLRVFNGMKGGQWHTLSTIARSSGAPEASVSARLRDLRKPRFGGHTVDRRRVIGGLFEYRLVINTSTEARNDKR